jgi:hypothetical protein
MLSLVNSVRREGPRGAVARGSDRSANAKILLVVFGSEGVEVAGLFEALD